MIFHCTETLETLLAVQLLTICAGLKEDILEDIWATDLKDFSSSLGKSVNPRFENHSAPHFIHAAGSTISLPCQVQELGPRFVSWIRKKDLHILSTGTFLYTSDNRFHVNYDSDVGSWNLNIRNISVNDSGSYECQISTEPKMSTVFNLTVVEPVAKIFGPRDVHVGKGSDLVITCLIEDATKRTSAVTWKKEERKLDITTSRGGISIHTETRDGVALSRILLLNVTLEDRGEYSCMAADGNPAKVFVHVSQGEVTAAIQSTCSLLHQPGFISRIIVSYAFLILFLKILGSIFIPTSASSDEMKSRSVVMSREKI